MAKNNNLTDFLTNTADAIRTATGTTGTINPQDFESKITALKLSTQTSSATASASEILEGETAYVNGSKITGTMANNGAVSQSLSAGGSYTIPAGYHNGSGKVTAASLASQTDGTAVAGDILSGKTAYVDGAKVTGTIATKTSSDLTASGATVSVPAGYYASAASKSVTTGSAKTPATTITKNPTISVNSSGLITASVSGTQSVTPTVTAGYVSSGTAGTITVSGSATSQLTTQAAATITPSTSSQTAVAAGKYTTGAITVAAIPSAYVKPTATKAAATITPTTSNQTIAAGTYCSGAQTIAGDADLVAANIRKGKNIFGVAGTYGSPEIEVGTDLTGYTVKITPLAYNWTTASGYIFRTSNAGVSLTEDMEEEFYDSATGKTVYPPGTATSTYETCLYYSGGGTVTHYDKTRVKVEVVNTNEMVGQNLRGRTVIWYCQTLSSVDATDMPTYNFYIDGNHCIGSSDVSGSNNNYYYWDNVYMGGTYYGADSYSEIGPNFYTFPNDKDYIVTHYDNYRFGMAIVG